MLWRLQDRSSYCFNVFRWSNGPRHSNSPSFCTASSSERIYPCNDWFPVRNRAARGYIEMNSKGALCCNKRLRYVSKSKLRRRTRAPTTPTHEGNWTYFQENFKIGPNEWDHAYSDTTSTAELPGVLKKEVMLPHLLYETMHNLCVVPTHMATWSPYQDVVGPEKLHLLSMSR